MIRFEDHLPRAASIAELDGLIAEFHKLERGCSGTVRLYGAPKKRLERLRAALRERLTASLPESGDTDRWINDLMIWAAARPGVETLRFRAPDGTVLASVDGAATASGRKAAARFLDNVSAFASQSNILPEQDTPQHTGASDSITERVEALRLRYRASTFAAWYAAGQCLLDAVQAPGIEPRTLLPKRHVPLTPRDLLGPNDPCSAFLAAAERELRSAEGPLPVWVASLRDMRSVRLLTRLPGNGTPLSETAELLGEPSEGARQTLGNLETLFRARTAWTDYRSALAALSSETGTSDGLVRLARSLYGGELNGALRAADDAWQGLAAALEARNPDLRNDPLPLSLMRAPLLFAAGTATAEAAAIFSSAGQPKWSALWKGYRTKRSNRPSSARAASYGHSWRTRRNLSCAPQPRDMRRPQPSGCAFPFPRLSSACFPKRRNTSRSIRHPTLCGWGSHQSRSTQKHGPIPAACPCAWIAAANLSGRMPTITKEPPCSTGRRNNAAT